MGFIEKYFLQPMGHYYTLPATIVYALIFVVAVFLVYKYILKKMKMKVDKNFILSLVPFIFLGGIMRALEDAGFYHGYFFVSPGIYVTLFFVTLAILIISALIQKKFKFDYWKTMLITGTILCAFNLYEVFLFGLRNWRGVLMILGLVGMWAAVFAPIHLKFPKYLSRMNYSILVSHLFDGSSTFVALTFFGYAEQHVLPTFLIGFTGPWIMFPLKIFIVWPVLYLIDKYVEDEGFRNWLKIAILILGLALGTRDMLKVGMMVP
ncbi:MAG: DUF63 family protein [Candidatus Aenigmarchaeota archaeon]|nr:DUF63 family protein [Candidatus Aenigmarchaeota archaeon]